MIQDRLEYFLKVNRDYNSRHLILNIINLFDKISLNARRRLAYKNIPHFYRKPKMDKGTELSDTYNLPQFFNLFVYKYLFTSYICKYVLNSHSPWSSSFYVPSMRVIVCSK